MTDRAELVGVTSVTVRDGPGTLDADLGGERDPAERGRRDAPGATERHLASCPIVRR